MGADPRKWMECMLQKAGTVISRWQKELSGARIAPEEVGSVYLAERECMVISVVGQGVSFCFPI